MKIHKFGKFHQYSICHCQVINLKCFSYWFSIHEIHLFGRFLGPYSPKYSLIFAEVLTRGSTLASKNIVWNTIERFEFLSKRDGPKGSTFRISFAAPSEKPQPLDYPNMSKSKLYLLFPFRKKYYYFLHYLGYFWHETGRRHKWKDQNQNLTYSFSPTIVGQLPWKKIGSNTFQFCSYRSQRVFKSGCFFWYHTYI